MLMPDEDTEEVFAAIVTAKGEVFRLPPGTDIEVGGELADSGQIFNGGILEYVLVFLSGAISNGVVGNAAYDALKLGAKNVRYRMAYGGREDQSMFVRQVAELKVRVKLDKDIPLKVTECIKREDHWDAVVISPEHTYRVRVPVNGQDESVISVDLD